jgi:hypothetical protein
LSAHLLQGLSVVLFPSGFTIKNRFAGCWFIRIKCPFLPWYLPPVPFVACSGTTLACL